MTSEASAETTAAMQTDVLDRQLTAGLLSLDVSLTKVGCPDEF